MSCPPSVAGKKERNSCLCANKMHTHNAEKKGNSAKIGSKWNRVRKGRNGHANDFDASSMEAFSMHCKG